MKGRQTLKSINSIWSPIQIIIMPFGLQIERDRINWDKVALIKFSQHKVNPNNETSVEY